MSRPVSAAILVCRASLCTIALSGASAAFADPADDVFVPYATVGEREIVYAVGSERGRDGTRETQQSLAVGGSPTERWFSSVYAAWASQDGGPYGIDEWSWLNHVKLAAPGAWPVDVGILCEIARPHDRSDGTGLTCGSTLQVDTDEFQFNLNPLIVKHAGAQVPEAATLDYQWQVKGLWRPGIELGAQGFGSFGPWNHWAPASGQDHAGGPAIFAKWLLGGRATRLDAAWLIGVGSGSPKDVLRVRVQQDF